jgi:hypothetical protein
MNRESPSASPAGMKKWEKWDTHSGYIPDQQSKTPLDLFAKYSNFKRVGEDTTLPTTNKTRHPAKLPSLGGPSLLRGDGGTKKGREGFRTTLVNVVM